MCRRMANGEWRWSPMGLAGRDPVFYAQLECELAYINALPEKKDCPIPAGHHH